MQIIIDIPDNKYQWIKDNPLTYDNEYCEAIRNGTPLPKGHKRLIDADKLYEYIDDEEYTLDKYAEVEDVLDIIAEQPTIIEADKGSEDKK